MVSSRLISESFCKGNQGLRHGAVWMTLLGPNSKVSKWQSCLRLTSEFRSTRCPVGDWTGCMADNLTFYLTQRFLQSTDVALFEYTAHMD
ncbi:hypothetical protein M404DRAFT_724983 [Pisolithus tinctorius Marx 270]|uniref:Uncharacterized protein n=1 Tax=Pisolithus tinctorius Marx 270 TaxID=870435 RepID=A0A0C3NLC1_PISTI|nr:hypothetical protein M404DRAFT_724983 [Pisolithus tinctorius Marx 270]